MEKNKKKEKKKLVASKTDTVSANTVDSKQKSYTPCLFWRGSMLASSSLERVGISAAMVTTAHLMTWGMKEAVSGRAGLFGGEGSLLAAAVDVGCCIETR